MRILDEQHDLEILADTLWAERHVVEYLLFKLVTAKLVLAADERRFLQRALDEVERVTDALRQAEQRRAAALATIAASWGVPPDGLSLGALASRCDEPLRSVFTDHQEAFRLLASQIEETTAANRRLAGAALNAVQESLDVLTGAAAATTYTATGRSAVGSPRPTRLSWAL